MAVQWWRSPRCSPGWTGDCPQFYLNYVLAVAVDVDSECHCGEPLAYNLGEVHYQLMM